MNIYNYHPVTNEYTITSVADLDPIDQLPMIPGYATDVELIDVTEGFVAVFDGTEWVETENNRGTVYETSTKQTIFFDLLGVLPSTLTKLIPTEFDSWDAVGNNWSLDLSLVKTAKKEDIKQSLKTTVSEGFTTSSGITMDADYDDVSKFDSGVRLAEKLGLTDIDVRDFNNVIHSVSIADANTMVNELGVNYQTLLGTKWTLNANIDGATTQGDVEAISWL